MKNNLLLGILIAIHVFMAFFKLGHTPMWDDEASVVWFAGNYNKYQKVIGYDGMNLFSYRNGSLINNELEYNNPPLDIYFTSYVIKYIGDSDVIVRGSFAVLGVIALFIFLLCLKEITKSDKRWFMYSAIILILSINYIMAEQNARYYSLNFLFGSISLYATLLLARSTTIAKDLFLLLIQLLAIYFLFLSHYLDAVGWLFMCAVILLLKGKIKISLTHPFNYLSGFAYVLMLALFYWYFKEHHVLDRPDLINEDSLGEKYFKLTGWFFNDLNRTNIIPLWTVFFLIYMFIWKRKWLTKDFKIGIGAAISFLGILYILNPQNTSESTCYEIRYLYIIMPVLYLYPGYLLKLLHEKINQGKYIAPFILIVFVNTTLISYIPVSTPPRTTIINYLIEKTRPFPTAYSETLRYIQTNFNGKKKILTVPGFHNTVFLRYFSDKIEITNTLDSATTHLSPTLIDTMNLECLYINKCRPDYVFLFGGLNDLSMFPLSQTKYKKVDTIPIYGSGVDVTRPEFYWHSFGPIKTYDKKFEAVYILHD